MHTETEDEALTKWCPAARISWSGRAGVDDSFSINRTDTDLPASRCIASACMAWRWDTGAGALETHPEGGLCIRLPHGDNAPAGYCGLAGKP